MAEGALAVAMRSACGLVAATAAFQQLCATADPVVALTHCRWPIWDLREAAAADVLPIANVWTWEGVCQHERGWNKSESGSLLLSLYGPPLADPLNVTLADLQNWTALADAIPDQMLALSGDPLPDGSGFYLGLTKVVTLLPPGWIDNTECPDEIPPLGIATYQLHFGIR
ncbi:MAG TPA: hypothetical protein VL132_01285 [Planctomycetaceae bacterium]|nr:hypothetical protein [Planctomycetaceae bacterium]